METVMFTPDQQMAFLSWLIHLQENGLTLEEVIDGIETGTLTSPNQSE